MKTPEQTGPCNERKKEENPALIIIGSCGLHLLQGAFKNGVQATNWNISKLLKAYFAFSMVFWPYKLIS